MEPNNEDRQDGWLVNRALKQLREHEEFVQVQNKKRNGFFGDNLALNLMIVLAIVGVISSIALQYYRIDTGQPYWPFPDDAETQKKLFWFGWLVIVPAYVGLRIWMKKKSD